VSFACTIKITVQQTRNLVCPVAYPGIFFFWGGGSTNSVEDRG